MEKKVFSLDELWAMNVVYADFTFIDNMPSVVIDHVAGVRLSDIMDTSGVGNEYATLDGIQVDTLIGLADDWNRCIRFWANRPIIMFIGTENLYLPEANSIYYQVEVFKNETVTTGENEEEITTWYELESISLGGRTTDLGTSLSSNFTMPENDVVLVVSIIKMTDKEKKGAEEPVKEENGNNGVGDDGDGSGFYSYKRRKSKESI